MNRIWEKLRAAGAIIMKSDSGHQGQGGGNGDRGGGKGSGPNPPRQNLVYMLVAALISLMLVSYFVRSINQGTTREIPYNEFVRLIENDQLEKVLIKSDRIDIYPKEGITLSFEDGSVVVTQAEENPLMRTSSGQVTYYTGKVEEDDTLTARLLEHGVEISGDVPDGSDMVLTFMLSYVVPVILMWVLLGFLFRRMGRGGGIMGVGKSTAKEYVQKETGVTFADVAGEDEAKESLEEVVDFLHNPGRYA